MLIALFLLSKQDFVQIKLLNYSIIIFIFQAIFPSLKDHVFCFFCFPNIIIYILDVASAIKKILVNELRYFIFEKYYTRAGFVKERSYCSMKGLKKRYLLLATKLIEKIPNPGNAKEYYQSFIRKKNKKSAKQSEIITYQPKIFKTQTLLI